MRWSVRVVVFLVSVVAFGSAVRAESPVGEDRLRPADVFELEWASDPRISPDGRRVVYVRNFMDVMQDVRRSNLWLIDLRSGDHRPLTSGEANHATPRWSPDGGKLLYVSNEDESAQLYLRWMDTGQTAKLSRLRRSPGGVSWSPDGQWIAFSMLVPRKSEPLVQMPDKPDGAEWAEPVRVIEKLLYRADGQGYLEDGFRQLFVMSVEGGTPRRLTRGEFNHPGTPAWTPDGKSLVFSANRHEDWEYEPRNSEVYEISVADGAIRALTDRVGPDGAPVVSPDGSRVAYTGFDDAYQGYQVTRLYVMNRDGSERRVVTATLDRSVRSPRWAPDGRGLYFLYSDEGNGRVGYVSLNGQLAVLAANVGGTSIGRPYASGSFTVADDGQFAFTLTTPEHPADVAVGRLDRSVRRMTRLNADLLERRQLAEVEEIRVDSSFDGRSIQGWIALPPGFDPEHRHPLILEIHGGPFADYGDRFSMEVQLFAAAGHVVVYANPRGSTSYGEEFGNLIHHDYPGRDYDDLMSVVDAVVERGHVDPDRLFVTGGSGGGVLTSWIVGKTDRFRAAVVAKPVINWYSFALTADAYNLFYKYWFPGFPWDHPEHYMRRSPISLVGNVSTPTMVLIGEEDYRTPISESEQYYQALKLRKVEAALVRIPGASHGIARRPSNMIAKVASILAWFERYEKRVPGGG